MREPTFHDYGLTDEDVKRLVRLEHRLLRISGRYDRLAGAGSVVGFISWIVALAIVSDRYKVGDGWLTVSFFVAIFSLPLIAFLLSEATQKIISFRISNIEQYKQCLEAKRDYDWWFRRTQREYWQEMDGWTFEFEVAKLLNKSGYKAQTTSGSNDYGVDIFLSDGAVVQCKAHKKPVSHAVVRELYGAMAHFDAPSGILVSLNGFTKGTIAFVLGKPIEMWDVDDLISMQKQTAA